MRIGKDFICDSIKVMENGEGKKFVGMPSVKGRDGEYKSLCNPVTAEFRGELYNGILDKQEKSYNSKINGSFLSNKPDYTYKASVEVSRSR
jgi:stage V sporulation protein G